MQFFHPATESETLHAWRELQFYALYQNKLYKYRYSIYTMTCKTQANKHVHVLFIYLHTLDVIRYSPADRLSRADLLSISRAFEVEDLMWSLKDLCSSSSLMERDMLTHIQHRPDQNYVSPESHLVSTPVPDQVYSVRLCLV